MALTWTRWFYTSSTRGFKPHHKTIMRKQNKFSSSLSKGQTRYHEHNRVEMLPGFFDSTFPW